MSNSPISSVVVVVQEQPTVVEIRTEQTLVVDGSNPAQVVEVIAPPVQTLAVVHSQTVTLLQAAAQGPAGPAGPAGNAPFEWQQSIALAVWTVPHNRNAYPQVTVTDHLRGKLLADVSYIDPNTVQITHATPLAGYAYLS
jgi:hypothetical protein